MILFLTHYLSAGMIGIGILLESLFGLNLLGSELGNRIFWDAPCDHEIYEYKKCWRTQQVKFSLYSKRTTWQGAIAGIFGGSLVVMVWPHLNPAITSYAIPAMIPGFLCSMLSIMAVSRLTCKTGGNLAV